METSLLITRGHTAQQGEDNTAQFVSYQGKINRGTYRTGRDVEIINSLVAPCNDVGGRDGAIVLKRRCYDEDIRVVCGS